MECASDGFHIVSTDNEHCTRSNVVHNGRFDIENHDIQNGRQPERGGPDRERGGDFGRTGRTQMLLDFDQLQNGCIPQFQRDEIRFKVALTKWNGF